MSDTDYSHLNEPNEDALEAMMDSAMALANTLGTPVPTGRRFRGPARFVVDGKEVDVDASRRVGHLVPKARQADVDGHLETERFDMGHVVRGTPHYFVKNPDGTRVEVTEAEYNAACAIHSAGLVPTARQPLLPREQPPPPERAAVYAEAMAKALAEPPAMTTIDRGWLTMAIKTIEVEVAEIRQLAKDVPNPIIDHALTSIELGLLGLAKVVGNDTATR